VERTVEEEELVSPPGVRPPLCSGSSGNPSRYRPRVDGRGIWREIVNCGVVRMPIIADDVGNNVSRSTWFEPHTSRNDESPNLRGARSPTREPPESAAEYEMVAFGLSHTRGVCEPSRHQLGDAVLRGGFSNWEKSKMEALETSAGVKKQESGVGLSTPTNTRSGPWMRWFGCWQHRPGLRRCRPRYSNWRIRLQRGRSAARRHWFVCRRRVTRSSHSASGAIRVPLLRAITGTRHPALAGFVLHL